MRSSHVSEEGTQALAWWGEAAVSPASHADGEAFSSFTLAFLFFFFGFGMRSVCNADSLIGAHRSIVWTRLFFISLPSRLHIRWGVRVTSTSLSVPASRSGGGGSSRFTHGTHKTPKFSAACGGQISSKLRISHESEGFCPQFWDSVQDPGWLNN